MTDCLEDQVLLTSEGAGLFSFAGMLLRYSLSETYRQEASWPGRRVLARNPVY